MYEARLTLLYVFANLPTMDLPPLALEAADRERLMSDLLLRSTCASWSG